MVTPDILNRKARFFDRWAPSYDCLFTTVFYQAVHQRLLSAVQLPAPAQVLDLGCGTGRLLNRLAAQYPDLRGTGLDLSAAMIRQARRSDQHRPRLIFIQGQSDAMPFAQAEFDAVFCTISFLHYPEPDRVLAEVARVLKPGGQFFWVDYVPLGWGAKPETTLPVSPGGLRFYSRSHREELGNRAGLRGGSHSYLLGPVLLTRLIKDSGDCGDNACP